MIRRAFADPLPLFISLNQLQSAHTSNALVGTCKMGVSADPLSVVATDLRVHGLKGDLSSSLYSMITVWVLQ